MSSGPEPVSLPRVGRILSGDFSLPHRLAVVGGYLVLTDAVGDPALHIIDRATEKVVGAFGRTGEGPGEFRRAWSLDPVPGAAAVRVFDAPLGRVSYIDLAEVLARTSRPRVQSVNLEAAGMLLGPIWTDRGRYASLGFLSRGWLVSYDADGSRERVLADLPSGAERIPTSLRAEAYQGTLVAHPRRHLLAAVTYYGSRILVFRSDGTPVAGGSGPIVLEPAENVSAKGRGALRYGYVDAGGSKDYVFALFSGRPGSAAAPNFGRQVHVFDWSGEFRQALTLERDAIAVAVDCDATRLYVTVHEPVPAVDVYDLTAWHGPGTALATVN